MLLAIFLLESKYKDCFCEAWLYTKSQNVRFSVSQSAYCKHSINVSFSRRTCRKISAEHNNNEQPPKQRNPIKRNIPSGKHELARAQFWLRRAPLKLHPVTKQSSSSRHNDRCEQCPCACSTPANCETHIQWHLHENCDLCVPPRCSPRSKRARSKREPVKGLHIWAGVQHCKCVKCTNVRAARGARARTKRALRSLAFLVYTRRGQREDINVNHVPAANCLAARKTVCQTAK